MAGHMFSSANRSGQPRNGQPIVISVTSMRFSLQKATSKALVRQVAYVSKVLGLGMERVSPGKLIGRGSPREDPGGGTGFKIIVGTNY